MHDLSMFAEKGLQLVKNTFLTNVPTCQVPDYCSAKLCSALTGC